jgi:hypothetical protein
VLGDALGQQAGRPAGLRPVRATILNAWSRTLTTVTGNADRFLAAGLYGWQFANACELMRDYSGFDLAAAQEMLVRVFYPLNNQFLTGHNDACSTNYWANWDLCNMALPDGRALRDGLEPGRRPLLLRRPPLHERASAAPR